MQSQFPQEMLDRIERAGVIAVLVIDDAAHALPVAKALLEGGVDAIELTLRTPAAIESLKTVRRQVPQMLTGIGTAITTEQVERIVDAGAAFGVAPGLNRSVVQKAQALSLPFAPGIMTPSEIEAAVELGCRELKFFPAEPSGGIKLLTSMRAPYAHLGLRFVPLGGVNAANLADYIADPRDPGGRRLVDRNAQADSSRGLGHHQEQRGRSAANRRSRSGGRQVKDMSRFTTFGEIMARCATPGFLRFAQALPGQLDITFAGAEANVAASLAMLGVDVAFVTALPNNALADACLNSLNRVGVDTSQILRSDAGRLGLYFLETGANQRPSRITYDRDYSTISLTSADAYDWDAAFDGGKWFHVTGITPAISQVAAEATIRAVCLAREKQLTVSCDLNFRSKLWRWDSSVSQRELAGHVMREILPHVDVLIANEADCADVLDIRAGHSDLHAGHVDVEAYPDVARQLVEQFANIRLVATTLRESISASHNNWGAMLFDAETNAAHFAPRRDGEYRPYEIRNIVDRVGGGDAFAAGLMFALDSDDYASPHSALEFAVAASCLAHSITGDFNFSAREEIDALVAGSESGRVVR